MLKGFPLGGVIDRPFTLAEQATPSQVLNRSETRVPAG